LQDTVEGFSRIENYLLDHEYGYGFVFVIHFTDSDVGWKSKRNGKRISGWLKLD
jgi:hypothetical protein